MAGFTKLHSTILDSSVWGEPDHVRIVWMTMLAMADADGVVMASVSGLARRAVEPAEKTTHALEVLLAPDPDSRDGTTGERIEKVPGGWLILNHSAYRDKQTPTQAAVAARVRRHRAHTNQDPLQTVTSNDVTPCNAIPPSEAEAEAEKEEEKSTRQTFVRPSVEEARKEAVAKGMPESEGDKFHDYYEANGWRAGKNPMRNWRSAMSNWKRNWQEFGGAAKASAKKSQESYGGGVRPWSEVQRGREPADPWTGLEHLTDEERAELLKNNTGLRVRINDYNEWHKKYGQA